MASASASGAGSAAGEETESGIEPYVHYRTTSLGKTLVDALTDMVPD